MKPIVIRTREWDYLMLVRIVEQSVTEVCPLSC